LGKSTVAGVIAKTVVVLVDQLRPIALPDLNETTWRESEQIFRARWNFPNCCGALDGKHIRIQALHSFLPFFMTLFDSHAFPSVGSL
jgi:hypothetical protein